LRLTRRLRATLNRAFYGDQIPDAEPLAHDRREITGDPTPSAGTRTDHT
jgi:hypothetical protein